MLNTFGCMVRLDIVINQGRQNAEERARLKQEHQSGIRVLCPLHRIGPASLQALYLGSDWGGIYRIHVRTK